MKFQFSERNAVWLSVAMVSCLSSTSAGAACVDGGGNVYSCSGSLTSGVTILDMDPGLQIATVPGFSVNTATGDALSLSGWGAVSYTDANSSGLTATGGRGLVATANALSGDGTSSLFISTAGNILSSGTGVLASNLGAGSLTVQLGNVTTTGTGSNSFGVQISGSAAATGMTLTAGTIDAAYGGISAGSYAGFGTVSITTTGDVIGRSQTAIDANITRAGSSLNLDIGGNVSSATHTGIRAFLSGSSNSGNGTMTINVAGTVSGQATGIYADARGGSTLTLSAAGASGGTSDGIRAFGGSGAASITVTGLVQGAADNAGVNYMHSGSGTSTLSLASVQGGNYGAYLFGSGTGATVLSASGAISAASANSTAVGTSMTGNAGALDISVTSLSATLYGAYLGNDGRGATSFTATGPVTVSGANSTGVLVNQGANAGAVDLNLASVSSALYGVYIDNSGAGAVRLNAAGPIVATAAGSTGIRVVQRIASTGTDINLGQVSAQGYGVYITNNGQGTTRLTSSGTISATGSTSYGILHYGTANAVLDVNTVEAKTIGIYLGSTGEAELTVRGTVSGASAAISANGTSRLDVRVLEGAVVGALPGSPEGFAVSSATGALRLANSGTLLGSVSGGSGDDVVTNAGVWRLRDWDNAGTAVNAVALGAGNDTLTNLAGGQIIAALDASRSERTGFTGIGTFVNHGLLSMADGGTGDVVSVSGGTLTLASGSVLALDINAAGEADRVEVTGKAIIETGAKVSASSLDGVKLDHDYLVLSATEGVSGRFTEAFSAFLQLETRSDAQNAYIRLNKTADLAAAAATGNQQAVAAAIPASGELRNSLLVLRTNEEARQALEVLSGDVYASGQVAVQGATGQIIGILERRMRGIISASPVAPAVQPLGYAEEPRSTAAQVFDPVLGAGAGAGAEAAVDTGLSVWSSAYGQAGELDGGNGAADLSSRAGGFVAGADALAGSWRLGMVAGYGRSVFRTPGGQSRGTSNNYSLGAYGANAWGPVRLRTGVMHTWHQLETRRSVAFGTFSDQLAASYDARTFEAFGEIGYAFALPTATSLEPFAGVSYTRAHTDAYQETGGAARLSGNATDRNTVFSALGLRASHPFVTGIGTLRINAGASWKHAYGSLSGTTEHALAGGSVFSVSGSSTARDAAVVEAGASLDLGRRASLGLTYTGEFAKGSSENGVKADFRLKF